MKRFRLALIAVTLVAFSPTSLATAAPGDLTVFAGSGVVGSTGDGGPATAARLRKPTGVHADPSGDVYIADSYYGKIRKVDAAGIITTVAGTGTAGYSGDGGLATSAQLHSPSDVVTDSSGNLYIADNFNHRIRKVDAGTGIITTVAGTGTEGYGGDGGPAAAADLDNPAGVTVDTAGNILIADTQNHCIRRVDAATGTIATVAGTCTQNGSTGDGGQATAAKLDRPYGVEVDYPGNIYIPDQLNHRIRRVDAVTGIISAVAGSGVAGFADGAAGTAQFNYPVDIAVDGYGNLFVADQINGRVRRIDARTHAVSTVLSDIDDPLGVSDDRLGHIYVPSRDGHKVFRIETAVTCWGRAPTIGGTGGPDVIEGTPGPDVIVGYDGNDTLRGRGGDDIICGESGADRLDGGVGNDRLFGGKHPDVLLGRPGDDVLAGQVGQDRLRGGDGRDRLYGHGGDDFLFGEVGNDRLYGGGGGDLLRGDDGHDRLYGEAGDDVIRGGPGNDVLDGGDGTDVLRGGTGSDTCTNGETTAC